MRWFNPFRRVPLSGIAGRANLKAHQERQRMTFDNSAGTTAQAHSGVTLDSAAAAFCDDVREIARRYREESEPAKTRYLKRLEEIKAVERAARAEYRAEAMEINRKYRARIEHAANIRKERYDRPEQIEKAACTVCALMGGVMNDELTGMSEGEADNARLIIENAERERLQANEAFNEFVRNGRW